MSTINLTATAAEAGQTTPTPSGASASRRVHDFWAMLLAKWRAYCRFRRDLDELSIMSDRMLADIGISRSEIAHVLRHGRDRD